MLRIILIGIITGISVGFQRQDSRAGPPFGFQGGISLLFMAQTTIYQSPVAYTAYQCFTITRGPMMRHKTCRCCLRRPTSF